MVEEQRLDQNLYSTYLSRINSVLDYIEQHLAEPLTLEELSDVANFSRFHFHRIFSVFMGETLSHFIWRLRLEKAAVLLANDSKKTVSEIALDCGFSSPSSFSRSFKKYFELTPLEWRKEKLEQSNLDQEEGNYDHTHSNERKASFPAPIYNRSVEIMMRRTNMEKMGKSVTIKQLPETDVAYVRYIGPYAGDEKLFETLFNKLCAWAGPRGLLQRSDAQYLIIYHDNPDVTEEDKLRLSVCVTVPKNTRVEGEIGRMTIAAGEYAAARFELDSSEYGKAWDWLYGQWLPQSGYLPDDRLPFELYPTDVKSECEDKKVVDIYLPVKKI